MGMLDRIKNAIWGTSDLTPSPGHDPIEETYLGTDQAGSGFTPELETQTAASNSATHGQGRSAAPAPAD